MNIIGLSESRNDAESEYWSSRFFDWMQKGVSCERSMKLAVEQMEEYRCLERNIRRMVWDHRLQWLLFILTDIAMFIGAALVGFLIGLASGAH